MYILASGFFLASSCLGLGGWFFVIWSHRGRVFLSSLGNRYINFVKDNDVEVGLSVIRKALRALVDKRVIHVKGQKPKLYYG